MRLSLLTLAVFLVSLPALAQLTGSDIAPGDACTPAQVNRVVVTADADGDGRGVVLICNGASWLVEQPTFSNSCIDGDSVTYNAATGGLSCGIADTIDPIWITPSGIITTTDVNMAILEVVSASDERGSPTFQKILGAGWINVATNGTVSGDAPAVGGTYSVTIRATDGSGNTADRTFDVVVNPPGGPAGCTNPGDVCPDGTIFAGVSPDGDVDFFATQQDLPGEDWTFNDGGSSWINTALPDCTYQGTESTCRTGESNTNILATLDSDGAGGTQIHRAALACFCLGETHTNAPNATVPSECAGDPVGTNSIDGHGFDDWYLPAPAELDVMFVNLINPSDPDNPTWQDGADGGSLDTNCCTGPQAGTFGGWFFATSAEQSSSAFWSIINSRGEYTPQSKNMNFLRIRCARH